MVPEEDCGGENTPQRRPDFMRRFVNQAQDASSNKRTGTFSAHNQVNVSPMSDGKVPLTRCSDFRQLMDVDTLTEFVELCQHLSIGETTLVGLFGVFQCGVGRGTSHNR